jgi:hypothetical protein
MRISVRSSICQSSRSQASRFSRASQPYPNRPQHSACSPQEATPSPGEPVNRGRSLIVPGCGEEIIHFEGPLSVTREEYRVAPMAGDGWRRNLGPLPFRPLSVPSGPPGLPRLPALRRGAGTRGLAAKPV